MSVLHVLKYHVVVPAAIFVVLIVVGVPFGSAFFVGLMAGCLGMMLTMMGGGMRHGTRQTGPASPESTESDGLAHRVGD